MSEDLQGGEADQSNSERAVIRGTFEVEIEISSSPNEVFLAYADLTARRKWFNLPGSPLFEHELHFRIGGHDSLASSFAILLSRLEQLEYRSHILEIISDQRIVLSYALLTDGVRRWVSLVTFEIIGEVGKTQLRHCEQSAFFSVKDDGRDDVAHLKGGTRLQHNGLLWVIAS